METSIYLKWFRDQGLGQLASDAVGAIEVIDGTWPVALLPMLDTRVASAEWRHLLTKFRINATTYHETTWNWG